MALAVYAFIQITCIDFNIDFDENLSYAIFLGVIVAYNFLKYAGEAKRYLIVKRKRTKIIQAFSFLCATGALFFLFQLPLRSWILLGLLTLVSTFYMIPTRLFGKNIRSLSGLKIFVVALVWALVTVMLPALDMDIHLSRDLLISFVQRFLYVVAIMMPFEIRDLNLDDDALKTLPQQLGIKKAKLLGITIMVVFYLLDYFKHNLNTHEHIVLSVITVISILMIHFSKEGQGKYYSAFWVEGIPVLWWLLLILV